MALVQYSPAMRFFKAFPIGLALALIACDEPNPEPPFQESISLQDTSEATAIDSGFLPTTADIAAIQKLLAAEYSDFPDENQKPTFKAAKFDLNEDGADEILVRLESRGNCGSGGCTSSICRKNGDSFDKVSGSTITQLPVGVLDESDNGWRSITVGIGGGGQQAGHAILRFDGKKYPLNPTMPPAEPTDLVGTVLLSKDSPSYPILE